MKVYIVIDGLRGIVSVHETRRGAELARTLGIEDKVVEETKAKWKKLSQKELTNYNQYLRSYLEAHWTIREYEVKS